MKFGQILLTIIKISKRSTVTTRNYLQVLKRFCQNDKVMRLLFFSRCLQFSIFTLQIFKGVKNHKLMILVSNKSWQVGKLKRVWFRTQSSKSFKISLKNIGHDYICQLTQFYDRMIYDSKNIYKNEFDFLLILITTSQLSH